MSGSDQVLSARRTDWIVSSCGCVFQSPVLLSCAIDFPDAWQDSDPSVLHASLSACIDDFAADDRQRRLKDWRLRLRESLDLEHGRVAYQ